MYSNGTAAKAAQETTLPPHSESAERAVLYALLVADGSLYDVMDVVNSDDFYIGKHRDIYGAAMRLQKNGAGIDPLTLSQVLKAGKDLEDYIWQLMLDVPNSMNYRDHARIVRAHSIRRKLMQAASKIATLASDTEHGIDDLIEQSERALFSISQAATTKQMQRADDGMSALFDLVQKRRERGDDIVGIPTGFVDIDVLLEGLEPGNLYIVAGRPGMGKSLFESAIAIYNAARGRSVARFNLEMPAVQTWQRAAAALSGINFRDIRKGKLTDNQMTQLGQALGEAGQWRMWVDDTPALTLSQMSAKCRRIQAEHGLDMVTVDFLQLMGATGNHQNRNQEVGYNSRGLKNLAKNLNVPIVALAQLSRQVEQRSDKHPQLSDLRDSGEIEQDADAVLMLYRDEYYAKDLSERPNQVDIGIEKNRHGETGQAILYFDTRAPKLSNMVREHVSF
jgi:replicative DNA helicase